MVKVLIDKAGKSFKKNFDSESKTLFKNSSWVFLANIYSSGLAFLRSIVIARGLGAEILGTYSLSIAFVITTQELVRLNLSMGLIKFGAQYQTENRLDKLGALIKGCIYSTFLSAFISTLLIAVIVFFGFNEFINRENLDYFIVAFACVNGFSFLDAISKGVLKLYFKFKINSIIQMIMDTSEFIIIFLTIYFYPKRLDLFFTAVIISKFLNSMICNAAAYWELRKEIGPYLSSKLDLLKNHFKEISGFIIGNSLSGTLKVLMNQGDVLILGSIAGTRQVGFYSVAKKLAYALLAVTDPLVVSIYPQLSVLVSKKKFAEARLMLFKITRVAMIPSLVFLALAYFLKDWIIINLYGGSFKPAGEPFFYLLAGAVQGSIFFWCLPLIQSLGLTSVRFKVYLTAILIGGIIALALTPSLQATGVAIGLLCANIYITSRFVYAAYHKIKAEEKEMNSFAA